MDHLPDSLQTVVSDDYARSDAFSDDGTLEEFESIFIS